MKLRWGVAVVVHSISEAEVRISPIWDGLSWFLACRVNRACSNVSIARFWSVFVGDLTKIEDGG